MIHETVPLLIRMQHFPFSICLNFNLIFFQVLCPVILTRHKPMQYSIAQRNCSVVSDICDTFNFHNNSKLPPRSCSTRRRFHLTILSNIEFQAKRLSIVYLNVIHQLLTNSKCTFTLWTNEFHFHYLLPSHIYT